MTTREMPALFTEYELTERPWLGSFFYGRISDAVISDSYLEAARRLRASAASNEDVERVFFPILFLYRHVIELQLKHAIHESAYLRRLQGDQSEDLEYSKVEHKLTYKIGHKIAKLVNLLEVHKRALEDDELSVFAKKLLELLDSTGPSNTKFRYAGQLPDQHISIDIDRLIYDLETLHRELFGVIEYLIVRTEHEAAGES